MKDFIQRLTSKEEPCDIFAMSNLGRQSTGIDNVIIWISPKMGSHGPRIKVSKSSKVGVPSFSVSISSKPEVKAGQNNVSKVVNNKMLKQIFEWIILNEEILIQYWHGEIELAKDAIDKLKPI